VAREPVELVYAHLQIFTRLRLYNVKANNFRAW
jgi:hypothetical protein